ncbi:MAG: DUF4292 domain-containing protein [Bacteroidia bacterium]
MADIDCVNEKADVVIKKIHDNALKFETYSSKIDVQLLMPNDNNQEFSASLRIKNDSAIWALVKVFGVPAATALITQDSVQALIKLPSKRYLAENISYLQNKFNITADYFMLEDILSGRPVSLNDEIDYFATCIDNQLWLMSHSLEEQKELNNSPILSNEMVIKYLINKENFYIEKIEATRLRDNAKLVVNYEAFEKIENAFVPTKTSAYFYTEKEAVQINITSSKIELNQAVEMPFSVTDKYEPIKIE